jgi:hypothetical protein
MTTRQKARIKSHRGQNKVPGNRRCPGLRDENPSVVSTPDQGPSNPGVALAESLGRALERARDGIAADADGSVLPHELAAKYAALDPQAQKLRFLEDEVANALNRLGKALEKAAREEK